MLICYFSNSWSLTLAHDAYLFQRKAEMMAYGYIVTDVYKYCPLGMWLYWPKQHAVVNWVWQHICLPAICPSSLHTEPQSILSGSVPAPRD